MSGEPRKPWLRQQLEPALAVWLLLLMSPALVAALKPVLKLFAVSVVLVIVVRCFARYIANRSQRW